MVDASGAWCSYWKRLVENWNIILNQLNKENVQLIVFSHKIKEVREKSLLDKHFICNGTNITLALQKIDEKIQ